jgi:tetratricopeptide (TPR) repeat protein
VTTIAELDFLELACADTPTTDGEIAIINLESARRRSWSKFFADPARDGVAETVVEHEQLTLQFVGDVSALDRLALLAAQFNQAEPVSGRTRLIQAQVASIAHRFSDARHDLAEAEIGGAPAADVDRLRLTIDQACGHDLDNALDARRRIATETGGLEDLVALASLLADLRDFEAADRAYKQALQAYRDVSPFPIARVCFQLGMLWGELTPKPNPALAAQWYRQAIVILPMYTKARVHLAEICSAAGNFSEAEELLQRVMAIGDPEVDWRLADVLACQEKFEESEERMTAAHSGFEQLLERHLLAFADHGAEFYAGSGGNLPRALHLARINADNRPTLRAIEQAHKIAILADDAAAAFELRSEATKRWGNASPFPRSSVRGQRLNNREGAAA